MDIHRCRFVPYEASAIKAVAFSHPHLPTSNKHSKTTPARLAIGRANGDIEIWNPLQGGWLQEMTIAGGQDRSVEGLAWVVGEDEELDGGRTISHGRMRLFSIGYTNTITEWDLETGSARRHASGQHGDIWCLAAQPKMAAAAGDAASADKADKAALHQRLVGGTIDGCLALYSTEDDDLSFQRLCRTHKKSVKMTSIAFQSRQIAVVGCSDSTVRVFDVRNGAVLHSMTLGRDLVGGARDIIVWSVRCLPSGDIVSGDSTGQICIWDGRTYTQAQRIQAHTQDVLSLATSADGSAIVSGGMDRRVVLYREMAGGHEGEHDSHSGHSGHKNHNNVQRWAKVWHRRYHHHDVNAMASFEARGISVVVAGGPDAAPVVLPLHKSGSEHHRTLSHLPQAVPVVSAPAARLVVCWWQKQAHIWSFAAPPAQLLSQAPAASEAEVDRNRRLVGRILVSGDANISSLAISPDGSLVVAVTSTEVKAFQLQRGGPAGSAGTLKISKVPVPASVASKGATNVAISPDGRWVCLTRGVDTRVTLLQAVRPSDGAAAAAAAPTQDGKINGRLSFNPKPIRLARLKRATPRQELFSGLGRYDRRITQIAFSPDSSMLATADLAGYVDTWVLRRPGGGADDALAEGGDEADDDDAAEETGGENGGADELPSEDEDDDEDEEEDDEDEYKDKTSTDKADAASNGHAARRWIRNPRARQFPKLSSSPVVLSFAPDVPGSAPVAGSAAADSTTTKTPARDYVLLAITATSRLFAFNPLRARLVPWFRRLNPGSLPVEYHNIRDLAKGVLWQGPRAWIYGASFMFMIDTSVDPATAAAAASAALSAGQASSFPSASLQQHTVPKKRKRSDDTGAGNKMSLGRLEPQRVQMTVPGEDEKSASQWVDVDMEDVGADGGDDDGDDDDDDDDGSSSEEEAVTRDLEADQPAPQAQKKNRPRRQKKAEQEQSQQQSQQKNQQQQPTTTRWWHTFKYRPILGVVTLASHDTASSSTTTGPYPPLEAAIVERPGWESDLPERYGSER